MRFLIVGDLQGLDFKVTLRVYVMTIHFPNQIV